MSDPEAQWAPSPSAWSEDEAARALAAQSSPKVSPEKKALLKSAHDWWTKNRPDQHMGEHGLEDSVLAEADGLPKTGRAPDDDGDPVAAQTERDKADRALREKKLAEFKAAAGPEGPSRVDSFARGLGNPLGWGDELRSLLQSYPREVMSAVNPALGASFVDPPELPRQQATGMGAPMDERSNYDRIHQEGEAETSAAREAHPLAMFGGELLSDVVTTAPLGGLGGAAKTLGGAVAKGAAGGAASGAVAGAGHDYEDRAGGALLGGSLGALFGGGAGAVSHGLAPKIGRSMAEGADKSRGLSSGIGARAQREMVAEHGPGELADFGRALEEQGLHKGLLPQTPEAIAGAAAKAEPAAVKALQAVASEADEAGIRVVSPRRLENAVASRLDEAGTGPRGMGANDGRVGASKAFPGMRPTQSPSTATIGEKVTESSLQHSASMVERKAPAVLKEISARFRAGQEITYGEALALRRFADEKSYDAGKALNTELSRSAQVLASNLRNAMQKALENGSDDLAQIGAQANREYETVKRAVQHGTDWAASESTRRMKFTDLIPGMSTVNARGHSAAAGAKRGVQRAADRVANAPEGTGARAGGVGVGDSLLELLSGGGSDEAQVQRARQRAGSR